MYDAQNLAPNDDARKAILTQMQQLWYDQAPYHILFYDSELHAYRTDRFGGWQNQPANGTPLFTYSILGETLLTDATLAPSPPPSAAASGGASAAPASNPASASAAPVSGGSSSGETSVVPIVVVAIVVIAVVAVLLMRRRGAANEEDDE